MKVFSITASLIAFYLPDGMDGTTVDPPVNQPCVGKIDLPVHDCTLACQNGGTCGFYVERETREIPVLENGEYMQFCSCPEGFSGKSCEVDVNQAIEDSKSVGSSSTNGLKKICHYSCADINSDITATVNSCHVLNPILVQKLFSAFWGNDDPSTQEYRHWVVPGYNGMPKTDINIGLQSLFALGRIPTNNLALNAAHGICGSDTCDENCQAMSKLCTYSIDFGFSFDEKSTDLHAWTKVHTKCECPEGYVPDASASLSMGGSLELAVRNPCEGFTDVYPVLSNERNPEIGVNEGYMNWVHGMIEDMNGP